MKFLRKIYYYLFCQHIIRKTIRFYKIRDNKIYVGAYIKCKRCNKLLEYKELLIYEIKNKKLAKKIIKKLEDLGIQKRW